MPTNQQPILRPAHVRGRTVPLDPERAHLALLELEKYASKTPQPRAQLADRKRRELLEEIGASVTPVG